MKYKVTSSSFRYEGKKYVRGDVIDVTDMALPGLDTRLERVPDEAPKRKRRTKAEMEAAALEASNEDR